MRVFIGIIVGILLTVGTAYLVDAMRPAPGPDAVATRPMVNWDVVEQNFHSLSSRVQEGWIRLTKGGKDA